MILLPLNLLSTFFFQPYLSHNHQFFCHEIDKLRSDTCFSSLICFLTEREYITLLPAYPDSANSLTGFSCSVCRHVLSLRSHYGKKRKRILFQSFMSTLIPTLFVTKFLCVRSNSNGRVLLIEQINIFELTHFLVCLLLLFLVLQECIYKSYK